MCALEHFLGFFCPGCGLTRSIIALFSGHLMESIQWHPMGVLVVLWGANLGWFRKMKMSLIGRKIISHAVLSGFFVPWIIGVIVDWVPRYCSG